MEKLLRCEWDVEAAAAAGADEQHVQDLEEDRLAMTKDIIWAYANAVSQVCVEDDGVSCDCVSGLFG
jgi:hypothetical protein